MARSERVAAHAFGAGGRAGSGSSPAWRRCGGSRPHSSSVGLLPCAAPAAAKPSWRNSSRTWGLRPRAASFPARSSRSPKVLHVNDRATAQQRFSRHRRSPPQPPAGSSPAPVQLSRAAQALEGALLHKGRCVAALGSTRSGLATTIVTPSSGQGVSRPRSRGATPDFHSSWWVHRAATAGVCRSKGAAEGQLSVFPMPTPGERGWAAQDDREGSRPRRLSREPRPLPPELGGHQPQAGQHSAGSPQH